MNNTTLEVFNPVNQFRMWVAFWSNPVVPKLMMDMAQLQQKMILDSFKFKVK